MATYGSLRRARLVGDAPDLARFGRHPEAGRREWRVVVTLIPAIAIACGACSKLGPSSIQGDRFEYNKAGAESSKEQLLLNIIRIRDGKPIYFVEIDSIIGQYSFEAEGTFSGWQNDLHGMYGPALRAAYPANGDDTIEPSRQSTVSGRLQYTDTPTINYRPLDADEFTSRVMSPIPPAVLIALARAGWGTERLLSLCADRINGIANPSLLDSPRTEAREASTFRRVASLFQRLQDASAIRFSVEVETESTTTVCHLPDSHPALEAELRELRGLLGYPATGELRLRVINTLNRTAPDELAIETRSVLNTMEALAFESAPTVAADSGSPWLRIARTLFPPSDAFVRTSCGGYWYSIPRSDWQSKRTMSMLSYLFSLQTKDPINLANPVVTVSQNR